MELQHLTFTNGYVGNFGKTWKTPNAQDIERIITGAMQIEHKTRDEIIAMLESGQKVTWCQSPNYYYDHAMGVCYRPRPAQPVEMVHCDCGHSVPVGQRMMAALGTSCADCYDRMSD